MAQLGLFDTLSALPDGTFNNRTMYEAVAEQFSVAHADVEKCVNGVKTWKRRRRFDLQGLKLRGLVERIGPDEWTRTGPRSEFSTMIGSQVMLAYSTELGTALWGDARSVAERIDGPVALFFTSPPYPLQTQRSYDRGPNDEKRYIDWLCQAIEPVIGKLSSGAALALNIGHDVFRRHSAARSTYKERLILAICDRFGLHYMDTIIWNSRNKAPSPKRWAQDSREQLFSGYEPIIWFTNNPNATLSDNTRITTQTGAINRNVWHISTTCGMGRQVHQIARDNNLPIHDALMPAKVAQTAIEFWTSPGQLVVDLFSGSNLTGYVAENLGRHWISGEIHYEHLALGHLRFRENGFESLLA